MGDQASWHRDNALTPGIVHSMTSGKLSKTLKVGCLPPPNPHLQSWSLPLVSIFSVNFLLTYSVKYLKTHSSKVIKRRWSWHMYHIKSWSGVCLLFPYDHPLRQHLQVRASVISRSCNFLWDQCKKSLPALRYVHEQSSIITRGWKVHKIDPATPGRWFPYGQRNPALVLKPREFSTLYPPSVCYVPGTDVVSCCLAVHKSSTAFNPMGNAPIWASLFTPSDLPGTHSPWDQSWLPVVLGWSVPTQ